MSKEASEKASDNAGETKEQVEMWREEIKKENEHRDALRTHEKKAILEKEATWKRNKEHWINVQSEHKRSMQACQISIVVNIILAVCAIIQAAKSKHA